MESRLCVPSAAIRASSVQGAARQAGAGRSLASAATRKTPPRGSAAPNTRPAAARASFRRLHLHLLHRLYLLRLLHHHHHLHHLHHLHSPRWRRRPHPSRYRRLCLHRRLPHSRWRYLPHCGRF